MFMQRQPVLLSQPKFILLVFVLIVVSICYAVQPASCANPNDYALPNSRRINQANVTTTANRICMTEVEGQRKLDRLDRELIAAFENPCYAFSPTNWFQNFGFRSSVVHLGMSLSAKACFFLFSRLGDWGDFFRFSTIKQKFNSENNWTINLSPWLTIGRVEFYGNFYTDYAVFSLFFDPENQEPEEGIVGFLPFFRGSFLEVGGGNGVHASNTLFFESFLGWRGLLIEPTVCALCQLPFNRPLAHIHHGALCLNSSRFDSANMADGFCPKAQRTCNFTSEAHLVLCEPMSTYLAKSNVTALDFVSIDVESHYMTALRSLEFDRFDIRVLLVEGNSDEIAAFLRPKGYNILTLDRGQFARTEIEVDVLAWKNNCK
jgi:hypothetical protein